MAFYNTNNIPIDIRALRKELGMTRKVFAFAFEVNKDYLPCIESKPITPEQEDYTYWWLIKNHPVKVYNILRGKVQDKKSIAELTRTIKKDFAKARAHG